MCVGVCGWTLIDELCFVTATENTIKASTKPSRLPLSFVLLHDSDLLMHGASARSDHLLNHSSPRQAAALRHHTHH